MSRSSSGRHSATSTSRSRAVNAGGASSASVTAPPALSGIAEDEAGLTHPDLVAVAEPMRRPDALAVDPGAVGGAEVGQRTSPPGTARGSRGGDWPWDRARARRRSRPPCRRSSGRPRARTASCERRRSPRSAGARAKPTDLTHEEERALGAGRCPRTPHRRTARPWVSKRKTREVEARTRARSDRARSASGSTGRWPQPKTSVQ